MATKIGINGFMPMPLAILPRACPILPKPTMPRVLP